MNINSLIVNHKSAWIEISLAIIFLFISSCSENGISSSEYKEFAHGYWKAVSGDTSVSGEIGLIVYNWYAIDTESNSDSVYVTWDDGLACTKTGGIMNDGTIEMSIYGIKTIFIIKSDIEASVTFKTNNDLYEKQLSKLRDDPRVLCD